MPNYIYNPVPPRTWSRVQNKCTSHTNKLSSGLVYLSVPLTGEKHVTLAQAAIEDALLQKGNILQYKGNSSCLTKNQRYAQLAKGGGPNRTKTFATQSQTYTNPNTSGLARVNSVEIPFPNTIDGQQNNISGPFQYAVDNPYGCLSNSLQIGGNLLCGTYMDPCSGEIIKNANTSATICNPASASNVPGSSILCWNKTVQSWTPRTRHTMGNSGNKWPQGYKGFISAVKPAPPTISINTVTSGLLTLLITPNSNDCYPASNFNVYIDGILFDNVQNVSKTGTLYTIPYDPDASTPAIQVTNLSRGYSDRPDTTVNNLNTSLSRQLGYSKMKSYVGVSSSNTVRTNNFKIQVTSVIETRNTVDESDQINTNIIQFDHANYPDGFGGGIPPIPDPPIPDPPIPDPPISDPLPIYHTSVSDIGKSHLITNTNNDTKTIILEDFLEQNDTVLTINNSTGEIMTIQSSDLIYNNLFAPEGTYNFQLNDKSSAKIFNTNYSSQNINLKHAIVF